MDIICPRCGVRIPAVDVNLHTLTAKCQACNAIFSVAQQLGIAPTQTAVTTSTTRLTLDMPLPERFSVDHPEGALRISWRWFTPAGLGLLFFAVLWNGFVCFWIAMALSAGAGAAALFSVIHVLVGIGIGYGSLTTLLNRTTVEVTHGSLTITHGPLPVTGYRHLARTDVRQLYGVEKLRRAKRSTIVVYDLLALTNEGKTVTLLNGIEQPEHVLYLEQEIERFFGITDEPIRGELPK